MKEKAVKKKGVIVGGITGALWMAEITSFLSMLKKNRGTLIKHSGYYPRLFPIMGFLVKSKDHIKTKK